MVQQDKKLSFLDRFLNSRKVEQSGGWTRHGAHLLLQTRVQVLNDDLRDTFCRWFPGMNTEERASLKAAA
jgi:hypothetical protein